MPVPRIALPSLACATLLMMGLPAPPAFAAETVHLFAKDGKGDIKGESSQKSMGRGDSIECVEFELSASVPTEGSAGSTGRMQNRGVRLVKRIDKSSPRLMQDLATGASLGQCVFRFFRPNPMGDGTTQQFYTVTLTGARIVSLKQFVTSTIAPATSSDPPLEEVTFAYRSLDCVFVENGDNARWGAAPSPNRTKTANSRRAAPQPSPARSTRGHGTQVAAR